MASSSIIARTAVPLALLGLMVAIAFVISARAVLLDAARNEAKIDLQVEERLLTRDAETSGGLTAIEVLIFRQQRSAEFGDRMLYEVQRTATGDIIVGNYSDWPTPRQIGPDGWAAMDDGNGQRYVMRSFTLGRGFEVRLARPISVSRAIDRTLLPLFLMLTLFAVSAAIGWLWLVGFRTRSDVRRLQQALSAATNGDLTKRVDPASLRYREFTGLGRDINIMLEQLDSSMRGLKDISGHISHELAMPLARLSRRARELASENAEMEEAVAPLIDEVEAMRDQFSALLEIYELEAGADLAFEEVAIAQVVAEALELYEEAAAAEGIAIDLDIAPCALRLSYWQMVRALANVIDNALRFTPEGGTIRIAGQPESGGYRLSIRDEGPGVEGKDLASLLAALRSGEFGKSTVNRGLGLRLVKASSMRQGVGFTLNDAADGPGSIASFLFSESLACVSG